MHRPTVAVVAVVLLLGGVVLAWFPAAEGDPFLGSAQGACVRLGIVMGALWLALPQLERFPTWLSYVALAIVVVGVFASKPRMYVFVLPIVLLLWATRRAAAPPATRR